MLKLSSLATILGMVSVFAAGSIAENHLLTDNNMPGWVANAVPQKEKRLPTGAELSWVTDGEFKCNAELIKTGSRPEGKNRTLLDGRIGSEGDYQAFGSWGGGVYYGSFTINLKNQYLITKAAVWSQQTDTQAMESFEILLSNDGKKFISMGICAADPQLKSGTDRMGIKFEYQLPKPAVAQYVMFRVKKKGGAMQMILSEVAIWGNRPPAGLGVELLPENQRPDVAFTTTAIQSGAVLLDWSAFAQSAHKVKKWKLYDAEKPFKKITDPGVTLKEALDPKVTRKVIYPLNPGQQYYFGITAEYEDGEYPGVKTVGYIPPQPFSCEKFSDMLAINHFWGGGGARFVKRQNSAAWEQVALDLLAKTPFKETRWWCNYPEIIDKFYEHGIGTCPFPSEENYKNGKQMGLYAYSAGNEPEISGKPLSNYLDHLKKVYQLGKSQHPANTISAPTTNMDDHALEWLDKFYAAGAKDYFDVLDLHTYMKNSGGFKAPAGYPNAAPEALFERMEKVKAIMEKYNDSAKPVISTEFGYTECSSGNPSGNITPEMKAQYLVRGLILHYILGFKRVYVYSFWDEGEDPNYTEHAFGMLDYNLQKKPAFNAVCVMGNELGNATGFVPVNGMTLPHFGYTATMNNRQETVSVIWDGSGSYSGTFATTPGKVKIISMLGEIRQLHTDAEGKFRLIFNGSPTYIHTPAPLRLLSTQKVEAQEKNAAGIELTTSSNTFTVLPGSNQVSIEFKLKNQTGENYAVDVRLEDSNGKNLASRKLEVKSGTEIQNAFNVQAPAIALEKYRISISYDSKYASFAGDVWSFVRKLQPNNSKVNVAVSNMHGWNKPVISLSNNQLEVTFDPNRGGRILEMIDKTTGTNQINLPYEKLGSLASISFAYSIWDSVKSENSFAISANAVYKLEKINNGIIMSAGGPGKLSIDKTYTLNPAKAELTLNVKITNNSSKELPVAYYMHPEYTVGGYGESNNDIIILPIGGQAMKIPFWNGLGEKKSDKLDAGWWAVVDEAAGLELRQEFSRQEFRDPRLWFGIGCYNLEMETVENVKLKPGESWTGSLKWQLKKIK